MYLLVLTAILLVPVLMQLGSEQCPERMPVNVLVLFIYFTFAV